MKTSVAMATFNGEKFVKEQIESILNQSVAVDEIIISDDMSTDNTISICKNILSKAKVKYKIIEHSVRQGVTENFFDAMHHTTGDIVFLCDQDDVWLKDKAKKFVEAFEKHSNVKVILSDAYITDEFLNLKNYLWENLDFNPYRVSSNLDLCSEMVKRNIFTGMSMAVDRSLLDSIITKPKYMLHDEFLGWISLRDKNVFFLNEKLALYRQHSNNVKGSNNGHKILSIRDTKKIIQESNDRFYKKFAEVLSLGFSEQEADIISKAKDFYEWQSELASKNILKAFFQCLNQFRMKNYNKYTSQSDHAFIKDMIQIFV